MYYLLEVFFQQFDFFIRNQTVNGITYPSNEHWFQASKAIYPNDHIWIAIAPTCKEAKRRGYLIKIKPNWEAIKIDVMRKGLRAKFSRSDLRSKLIKTYPDLLVEGNRWGD